MQQAGNKHAVGDSIPNCVSTVAARQKVHSLDPLLEIVIIVVIVVVMVVVVVAVVAVRRRGGHCNLQLPCVTVGMEVEVPFGTFFTKNDS